MILPGLLRAGKKIAVRSDGLHALVYYTASERKVALWRTESDLREVTLPVAELNSPACEFVGSGVLPICSSSSSGAAPARITEVTENGSFLASVAFGDALTRAGGSCRFGSGTVFVNWRFTAGLAFDVAYRADTAGSWVMKRIELPIARPTNVNPTVLAGPDGLVWVLFTMDSYQRVGLMRLRVGAGLIELVDAGVLIEQKDSDGISGENPDLSATHAEAQRVLLGYQDGNYAHYPIPNDPLGRAMVTSKGSCLVMVNADRTRSLVARLPWESLHVGTRTTFGWAQPDGIYFLQQCTNVQDWSWTWRTGRVVNGQIQMLTERNANGQVAASSDDGWIVERTPIDPVRFTTTLRRMPFAPVVAPVRPPMKVRLYGQEAEFDWGTPQPEDRLQYSFDGQSWKDWPLAGASPLWVTTLANGISFRVKV